MLEFVLGPSHYTFGRFRGHWDSLLSMSAKHSGTLIPNTDHRDYSQKVKTKNTNLTKHVIIRLLRHRILPLQWQHWSWTFEKLTTGVTPTKLKRMGQNLPPQIQPGVRDVVPTLREGTLALFEGQGSYQSGHHCGMPIVNDERWRRWL